MTSGIRHDVQENPTALTNTLPYRQILATVLLAAAVAVLLWGYISGNRSVPQTESYTYAEGSSFTVSVDRRYVWQSGDCVTLQWESEGLQAIWLGNNPTVGTAEREWCVRGRFAVPQWEITYPDGEVRAYIPFALHTRRLTALLYALPLLAVAIYATGLLKPLRRLLNQLPQALRAPFMVSNSVHMGLVGLFVAVNSLVAFNVFHHNPIRAYDAHGHYRNVAAYAEGRLPTPADSVQFYSSPLPYLIPTVVARAVAQDCNDPMQTCYYTVHKAGVVQNLAVSMVFTFFFLRVVRWFDRFDGRLRLLAFAMIATLPVYYKTLSFLRGEHFIMMFMVIVLDRLLIMLSADRPVRWADAFLLGIPMGLMMLSRQWAVLIMIAVAVWALVVILQQWQQRRRLLWVGLASFGLAFVLSSWFYFNLQAQQGSVIAASRDRQELQQGTNLEFDLPTRTLFTSPYRYQYGLQVLPIFYTEMWGDYFGFFQMSAAAVPSLRLMPLSLAEYIRRVNVVSVLPTALFMIGGLGGVLFAGRTILRAQDETMTGYSLLGLCVLSSLSGYLWFLSSYHSFMGDMAKATYMLQVFPLLAILAARALLALRERFVWAYGVVIGLFVAVALHNLPMMVTRLTQYG